METSAPFKLDGQTFYPLLKSCLRTGDMNLLSQLLDDMVKKHQLSLDRSAYALLIHGLCRANKCQWAYHLFEEMISKDIVPKYQTCHMLLEEVKLKSMYDTAEKIEDFMKKL
jgi:pentatricopeptide repeat protein